MKDLENDEEARAEELLGAYALDAVDDDERALVERVVAESPRLRAEVDDFREVAALLAYSGAEAPPKIWESISAELDGQAPQRPLVLPGGLAAPDAVAAPNVVALRRRPIVAFVSGAVAAAILLVAGFVAFSDDDMTSVDDSILAVAESVFDDPNARRAELHTNTSSEAVVARAAVLGDGTGFLVVEDLPALGADRTYQLWGIAGTEVISLGVLGSAPTVAPFEAGPGVTVLALTEEVAGGVAVSANPAIGVGQLTA